MATEAQIDANRRNAQDSTSPKTEAADTLSKLARYELRLTHRYNRTLTRLAWLRDQRTRSTASENLAKK